MARTQAADYDQRRDAIMRAAARVYAEHGFASTSVAAIATAAATSKSLIYHYYQSKEDILFDVMDSHVQELVEAAHTVADGPEPPARKLALLADGLMARYAGAEASHKVLLNELSRLPPARRATIIAHQRQLLDVVDGLMLAVRPDLAARKPERRALAMLFFGMLNWTPMWFDPAGAVTGAAVADLASGMFLAGLSAAVP